MRVHILCPIWTWNLEFVEYLKLVQNISSCSSFSSVLYRTVLCQIVYEGWSIIHTFERLEFQEYRLHRSIYAIYAEMINVRCKKATFSWLCSVVAKSVPRIFYFSANCPMAGKQTPQTFALLWCMDHSLIIGREVFILTLSKLLALQGYISWYIPRDG